MFFSAYGCKVLLPVVNKVLFLLLLLRMLVLLLLNYCYKHVSM